MLFQLPRLMCRLELLRSANGCAPVDHFPSLIATFTSIDAPAPQRATPATTCGTLRP